MRGRRLHHSSKLIIVSMSAVCLSSVRLRRVTISLSFQPSDAQWPFIEYNFAYNFVYDGARSQEDEMGKKKVKTRSTSSSSLSQVFGDHYRVTCHMEIGTYDG